MLRFRLGRATPKLRRGIRLRMVGGSGSSLPSVGLKGAVSNEAVDTLAERPGRSAVTFGDLARNLPEV